MGILANITGIFIACTMLSTIYPQEMLITTKTNNESNLTLVEKVITKKLDYFQEDIKMPFLINGNDENKINLINDKIKSNTLGKAEEAEKIAMEYFAKENKKPPLFPYEVNSTYKETEKNKNLISFYNDYYEYMGGAHGITIRTSYTIDKNSENLLSLKDLFVNGYDYKNIIDQEIFKQILSDAEDYFDSGKIFKGITDNVNFYIDQDNLIIYYQLYDIAPYVHGIPEFKIPLKLFSSNYMFFKDD